MVRIRSQASRDRAGVLYDLDASNDRVVEGGRAQSRRELTLNRALLELPHELHEIIERRHFQDASHSDIAEAFNIPIGMMMGRPYHARAELRQVLSNDVQFPNRGGHHE